MFTVESIVKALAVIFVLGLLASLGSMIRTSGRCSRKEEESDHQQKPAV